MTLDVARMKNSNNQPITAYHSANKPSVSDVSGFLLELLQCCPNEQLLFLHFRFLNAGEAGAMFIHLSTSTVREKIHAVLAVGVKGNPV